MIPRVAGVRLECALNEDQLLGEDRREYTGDDLSKVRQTSK